MLNRLAIQLKIITISIVIFILTIALMVSIILHHTKKEILVSYIKRTLKTDSIIQVSEIYTNYDLVSFVFEIDNLSIKNESMKIEIPKTLIGISIAKLLLGKIKVYSIAIPEVNVTYLKESKDLDATKIYKKIIKSLGVLKSDIYKNSMIVIYKVYTKNAENNPSTHSIGNINITKNTNEDPIQTTFIINNAYTVRTNIDYLQTEQQQLMLGNITISAKERNFTYLNAKISTIFDEKTQAILLNLASLKSKIKINDAIKTIENNSLLHMGISKDKVSINKCELSTNKILFLCNGFFNYKNNNYNLKINTESASYEQLMNYWPRNTHEKAHAFSTENVSNIQFSNFQINLFNSNQPENQFNVILNSKFTNGIFHINKYYFTNTAGILKIADGKTNIQISNGTINNNKIKIGNASIYKNQEENTIADISGHIIGDICNAITNIPDQYIGIVNQCKSGNSEIKLKLKIETNAKTNKKTISHAISWDITELDMPLILNKIALYKGKYHIDHNNKQTNISGSGLINAVPSEINVTILNKQNNVYEYKINSKYKLDNTTNIFNLKIPPAKLNGIIVFAGTIKKTPTITNMTGYADLSDTEINFTDFSICKKINEPSFIKIKSTKNHENNSSTQNILFQSKQIHSSTSIDNSQETISNNTILSSPNHESKMQFLKNKNDYEIKIIGKKFDASNMHWRNIFMGEQKATSIMLDIEIDKIKLNNSIIGKNLIVELQYSEDKCNLFDLGIEFAHNHRVDGVYSDNNQFCIKSTNAGVLLSSLGLINNIQGGSLFTCFDDIKKNQDISGILHITNFKIQHEPIIEEILHLGTLSSALSKLKKKGLNFSNLSAHFKYYKKGTLQITDGFMYGSYIDTTFSGTITKNTLNINGIVSPTHIFNKTIYGIPIVGELLLGGKNKSFVGINYSIAGNHTKPSVKVNPLSILTPGFLRNIFEAMINKNSHSAAMPN